MIAAIWFYLQQVFTRSNRVFLASDFLVAILVGCIVSAYGPRWMNGFPKTGDLANILVAYTAIALGFLVAALAIAITHPSEPLVATLANTSLPGRESSNAYSDLIFVFSWSAIVHWLQIVFIVAIVFTIRSDEPLLPAHPTGSRLVLAGALTFSVVYSLLRFLVSLITLVQVGEVYIRSLQRQSVTMRGKSGAPDR